MFYLGLWHYTGKFLIDNDEILFCFTVWLEPFKSVVTFFLFRTDKITLPIDRNNKCLQYNSNIFGRKNHFYLISPCPKTISRKEMRISSFIWRSCSFSACIKQIIRHFGKTACVISSSRDKLQRMMKCGLRVAWGQRASSWVLMKVVTCQQVTDSRRPLRNSQ